MRAGTVNVGAGDDAAWDEVGATTGAVVELIAADTADETAAAADIHGTLMVVWCGVMW